MGRGPVGVILTTMTDGFEVGKTVLKDIESNSLETRSGREEAFNILKSRGKIINWAAEGPVWTAKTQISLGIYPV